MNEEFNEMNIPHEITYDEDNAKSVSAFVEDDKILMFGEEFLPLFSKHFILSFLKEEDLALLMQMYDNLIISKIVNEDLEENELGKYEMLRMSFFAALRRAVGKNANNERILLGKTISEVISGYNIEKSRFNSFLFGKR